MSFDFLARRQNGGRALRRPVRVGPAAALPVTIAASAARSVEARKSSARLGIDGHPTGALAGLKTKFTLEGDRWSPC